MVKKKTREKNEILKIVSLAGLALLVPSLLLNIFLFQKTQNTDKFYRVIATPGV